VFWAVGGGLKHAFPAAAPRHFSQLETGCSGTLLLNILLTILGWLP
jgi:hypothetical protein